jgi:hypothetical protein
MTIYELLSVVISFLAIILAFITGIQNHLHNRMSVRPRLKIRYHLRGSRGKYGISVKNEGLGPALIRHFEIKKGTQLMKDIGDNGWRQVKSIFGLADMKPGYETIAPEGLIASGATVWLFSTEVNEDYIERLEELFASIDIKINYESMYAERFVEHFRRHTTVIAALTY